jgi:DNA-binding transcriptional MerR regulator
VRIGDVAAAAKVSVRALRYYEEQGLLEAERSPSGQRLYPDGAVDRVRWIQLLYGAGLSSKAIVDLLPCVHTGVATPEMLSRLAAEHDRIDQQVRDLSAARDRLEQVIAVTQAYTEPSTATACTADTEA